MALKKNSPKSKRICLMMDDDLAAKLRKYQAELIEKNASACSFSQALNQVVRNYLSEQK